MALQREFEPIPAPTDAEVIPLFDSPPKILPFEQLEALQNGGEIVDCFHLTSARVPGGELEWQGVITRGGYAYAGIIGRPDKPKTNIPIIGTSAWFTSTNGFNQHTAMRFVADGWPVAFLGAEGSLHDGLPPVPKQGISLAGSAVATLNFVELVGRQFPDYFDPQERLLFGESRGAMVGMGISALASAFGQNVLYSDFIGPCFPRKAGPKDALNFMRQGVEEVWRSPWLAARIAMSRLVHYPSTVDPHPYALANQLAIGPALFSGEAGDLARLNERSAQMHIICMKHDAASMLNEWRTIFKDYKGVDILPLNGAHLLLADPKNLDFAQARFNRFLAARQIA